MKYYVETEEWFDCTNDFYNIVKVEATLGGDHGKGCHSLVLSIIVRFSDEDREPDALDLECRRIEHNQDQLELLKILVQKLKPSLDRVTSGSGVERFIIANANSIGKNTYFLH